MIPDLLTPQWNQASGPLARFLPLAVAALITAIDFGVLWLVGIFLGPDQDARQRPSLSKGATP